MAQYYNGRGNMPSQGIPTSGTISLNDFKGKMYGCYWTAGGEYYTGVAQVSRYFSFPIRGIASWDTTDTNFTFAWISDEWFTKGGSITVGGNGSVGYVSGFAPTDYFGSVGVLWYFGIARDGITYTCRLTTWGGSGLTGIPTTGLLALLDANDVASWPGSGTTWYDTSGNDRHGTWNAVTTGTYNGKTYLSTNGGLNQCTGSPSNTYNITNTNGYTVFIVCRVTASSTNRAFSTGGGEIYIHLPWTNDVIYFDQGSGATPDRRLSVGTGGMYNVWVSVAIVRTVGSTNMRHIYYNGALVATRSVAAATLDISSTAAMTYVNSSLNWPADVMVFAIYDRGLSSEDVLSLHTAYHPG